MDKVVMFELPVGNVKRASAFYKAAFGWEITPWDGYYGVTTVPEDKNWMPKEKGAINGGMYRRDEKGEAPALIVGVPSITKTLAKVVKAGGRIVSGKEPHGDWGYYARVKDREGNIFALWQKK